MQVEIVEHQQVLMLVLVPLVLLLVERVQGARLGQRMQQRPLGQIALRLQQMGREQVQRPKLALLLVLMLEQEWMLVLVWEMVLVLGPV